MKRVFTLSVLILLGLFTISCSGGKRAQVLPPTELAFSDFILGGSFDDCYSMALNSQRYDGLRVRQDGLINTAFFNSLEIPNYKKPEENISLSWGEVKSYNDTIYLIQYSTLVKDAIIEMYLSKYGNVKPVVSEYALDDFIYNSSSWIWSFENGTLRLFHQTRKPKNLLSTLPSYDYRLNVSYHYDRLESKAEAYKKDLQEQEYSIQQAIQENKDRLLKTKEKERSRRIEEKQKSILDSLRF